MKIAVYNHGIAFDGSTPFHQPLGGSESSIVYMSRELARCGHEITVYVNCAAPGRYDGVPYHHYHRFFDDYLAASWDVVISFRSFDPFLLGRIAPRTIFWTGDAFDQAALKNFSHPSLQENIDYIFCVSEWHRQTFIDSFNLPPDKVIATRNGFCPELVPARAERHWTRAVYSSTPFRGLDVLLKMFPEMRRQIPALELDVFSSMKVYGWRSDDDSRIYAAIYEAATQPGVKLHGSVAQPVLLESLVHTGMFLYPNTFDETSCIAAIEAQASGCAVITSARGALVETVADGTTGVCLKGEPKSAEYQRQFVNTVCELLGNPQRLEQFSRRARERAFQKYTWASIASEWTSMFEDMPAQPVHARLSGPLALLQKTHQYIQNGNVSAATRVLAAMDRTPFFKDEVNDLKGNLTHGCDNQRKIYRDSL